MKLYELAQGMEEVINGGMVVDSATGEILFDSENLDALEIELKDKLEACGCYIKNLEAEAFALDQEARALKARKDAAVAKVKRMKEYVKGCMDMAGEKRLETPRVVLSQRKSTYLEVEDDMMVPEDYKTIEEVVKVDKDAIKKAIKNGEQVAGCELKERMNLQVK